jgi:hypothetical protein
MNASPPADRCFTVEQANRMLPLVRAIVSDIVELAGDLTQRNDRLSMLQVSDTEEGDPYSEEVLQMQREIERDMDRLQAFVDELAELGVELKSATEGLVDFRSRIDNREAYLCWKLGEEEVAYWHPLNAGFEGRQSLLEGAGAGDVHPEADSQL